MKELTGRARQAIAIGAFLAVSSTTFATTSASAAPRGTIELRGAQVLLFTYIACEPPTRKFVPIEATSFINAPLPTCQAVLINGSGGRFRLCEGRDVIPPAFHDSRQLLIQSGSTPRCTTP